MNAAFVIVRALHVSALVALLGGFIFATWVSRRTSRHDMERAKKQWRSEIRVSAACLVLAAVSGLVWLGFEAVSMSGLPPREALRARTLGIVLGQTGFGRVWVVRGCLGLILAGLIAAAHHQSPRARPSLLLLCAVVAVALLSGLAWVGHANAERGLQHLIHLTADAVHLAAAGAWLGALIPLMTVLGRGSAPIDAATLDDLVDVVRRFSSLGLLCVGALFVTGVVNASLTVSTFSGLLSAPYGQLLMLKIGLFGCMLALAASNRARLTPLLADCTLAPSARTAALERLRRNATLEVGLGAVILVVVGALGTTMPASHAARMAPAMHMHQR